MLARGDGTGKSAGGNWGPSFSLFPCLSTHLHGGPGFPWPVSQLGVQADAVALSPLLLKDFLSPSLQFLDYTSFLTPVASPALQLSYPCRDSIPAASSPSFSTPAAFIHSFPIPAACPHPPTSSPLPLLLYSSLLWAFILCCLCSQILALQVILCHPLQNFAFGFGGRTKPFL